MASEPAVSADFNRDRKERKLGQPGTKGHSLDNSDPRRDVNRGGGLCYDCVVFGAAQCGLPGRYG